MAFILESIDGHLSKGQLEFSNAILPLTKQPQRSHLIPPKGQVWQILNLSSLRICGANCLLTKSFIPCVSDNILSLFKGIGDTRSSLLTDF